MKAKRGDLVVISKVTRTYVIGQGSTVRENHEVHEVANITREGIVKRTRSPWGGFTGEPVAMADALPGA